MHVSKVETILKALNEATWAIESTIKIEVLGMNYSNICNDVDTWFEDFQLAVKAKNRNPE